MAEEITAASRHRARQRRTIAAAVVAVIGVSVSVALLMPEPLQPPGPTEPSGSTGVPPTAAATRSPPAERVAGGWVPPTRTEGRYVVMPLTFLDGTTAEIRYPRELDIANLGGRPYGSGELVGRAFEGCCVRDFAFFHTAGRPGTDDHFPLAASDEPIKVFAGADGRPVPLLPGHPGAETDYLVFAMGEWQLGVWDAMADEHRALWSGKLRWRTAPDGFPVLSAAPPLHLDGWADDAYGPAIEFGRAGGRQISFSPIEGCPGPRANQGGLPSGEITVVLCRPRWRMRVNVVADQAFADAVTEGLEVHNVRLAGR
jgi:hypothetical protein